MRGEHGYDQNYAEMGEKITWDKSIAKRADRQAHRRAGPLQNFPVQAIKRAGVRTPTLGSCCYSFRQMPLLPHESPPVLSRRVQEEHP